MSRNTTLVVCFVILAASVLIGMYIQNSRFSSVGDAKGIVYVLDRRTGDSWMLYGTARKAHTVENTSDSDWVEMSFEDRARLEATAIKSPYSADLLNVSLYNGTDWKVGEVTNWVQIYEPDGSLRWSREFRNRISVDPKNTGSYTISMIGAENAGSIKWGFSSARGVMPRSSK